MFFIPLSQIESVDLVIHALRMAGGAADCSTCPARKVCMKQCLTIAESVARMAQEGTLPSLGAPTPAPAAAAEPKDNPPAGGKGHLKVLK